MDIKLFYLLNNLAGRWPVSDWIFVFFGYYFPYLVVIAFLLLLFFSAYSKKEKIRIFYVAAISAIIARFGVTSLIRIFYHRPRPFLTYSVHQLIEKNEYSFPSGHAAFFFAMAMAVYFYNKKWGVWLFAAAVIISLSRVIAGIHYPTDILAGAAVGILSACAVFYLNRKIKRY